MDYPLTFAILIELADGTIRSPVWQTKRMKEHLTHPGWVEYDGWCRVETGVSQIRPGLNIELPDGRDIKTMFLLVKEWQKRRISDFDDRWLVIEYSTEQIGVALEEGISIPLLSTLPTISKHSRKLELLSAKTQAIEEFSRLDNQQRR